MGQEGLGFRVFCPHIIHPFTHPSCLPACLPACLPGALVRWWLLVWSRVVPHAFCVLAIRQFCNARPVCGERESLQQTHQKKNLKIRPQRHKNPTAIEDIGLASSNCCVPDSSCRRYHSSLWRRRRKRRRRRIFQCWTEIFGIGNKL